MPQAKMHPLFKAMIAAMNVLHPVDHHVIVPAVKTNVATPQNPVCVPLLLVIGVVSFFQSGKKSAAQIP